MTETILSAPSPVEPIDQSALGTCYDYIPDSAITAAQPFPGYNMRDRTRWPEIYNRYPTESWPGLEYTAAHAYHIQQLAAMMRYTGWIGPLPVIVPGWVWYTDGQHRVRAARYIQAMGWGVVEVPEGVVLPK